MLCLAFVHCPSNFMVIKTLFDLEKLQGVLQSAIRYPSYIQHTHTYTHIYAHTYMHTNTKEYFRVQPEIPFVYIDTHTLAHKNQGVLESGI